MYVNSSRLYRFRPLDENAQLCLVPIKYCSKKNFIFKVNLLFKCDILYLYFKSYFIRNIIYVFKLNYYFLYKILISLYYKDHKLQFPFKEILLKLYVSCYLHDSTIYLLNRILK